MNEAHQRRRLLAGCCAPTRRGGGTHKGLIANDEEAPRGLIAYGIGADGPRLDI
jgi:hypothetical protein